MEFLWPLKRIRSISDISEENIIENNQKLMEQTAESVENYLINMRQISDAAYYYVIKDSSILPYTYQ